MGGETFKTRLVCSVTVAIAALNYFVPLSKSLITDILKFKACLKAKFKWASVTMYSLVMSPFSHDFIKQKQTN